MGRHKLADRNPLPWRPISESCRNDARVSGDGRCYCCKLRSDGQAVRRG